MKTTSLFYALVLLLSVLSCSSPNFETSNLEESALDPAYSIAAEGDVQLSSYEIISYLPYWGYINDTNSTTNYDKYHYLDISTLMILVTIAKDTALSTPQQSVPRFIYGDGYLHANHQVNLGDMVSFIRTAAPNLKIMLALSDSHFNNTERAETVELVNNTNRANTINWLMTNYVDLYNLDGIDIDFEDTTLDPGYMGPYYSDFIKELADELHDSNARGRRKLCTATLAGGDYARTNIVTNDFKNSIDLLGIQTYSVDKMDYLKHNINRNMISDYTNWTGVGLPSNKLAFGLPMFRWIANPSAPIGYQYTTSYGPIDWHVQLQQNSPSAFYRAYLTSSYNNVPPNTNYEQRYNGLYEIRRRAEWVQSKSCRGVFTWELSKDPNKNQDPAFRPYSYLLKLMDWRTNPQNYLPIVAYTQQDYYADGQDIVGGFHSLTPHSDNWVGVYEFDDTQPFNIGLSTGVAIYLPATASGTITIPAWITTNLTHNKLYILRLSNGPNGIGNTVLGTSHPFYKL